VQRIDHTESNPLTNGFRSPASIDWRLEESESQVPAPTPVDDDGREPPKKPGPSQVPTSPGTGTKPGTGPGTSPTN